VSVKLTSVIFRMHVKSMHVLRFAGYYFTV